jgi:hypothetical protein
MVRKMTATAVKWSVVPITEAIANAEPYEKIKVIAPACMEALSTVCSTCDFMAVEGNKHNGSICRKVRCEHGFWVGKPKYNRLFNPKSLN